ncbi:PTS sugar transporter subunit IIB [Zobellella endophytica]|uniref:PTS sugar transporter subunit IIB n=1 Tax=Zobellella endophytica TaxID=2116700 RepID=A0A2P7RBD9_9GAMM|nr:PTS transporter subunit EIIB [Zobellella endophytica]PSJ47519.1 PTS sugar transporter subunit IIB [Zobellella endophytica]
METRQLAVALLDALGGRHNLTRLRYCASRVRLALRDEALLDREKIARLGEIRALVAGAGGEHQLVLGPGKARPLYQQLVAAGGLERLVAEDR